MNLCDDEKKDISAIFTPLYYKLTYQIGEKYLAALIIKILYDLKLADILKQKYCSIEVLMKLGKVIPERQYQFNWLIKFLDRSQLLLIRGDSGKKVFQIKEDAYLLNSEKLKKLLLKEDGRICYSCNFMEHVANYYADFLIGKTDGFDILFIKDKMENWKNYFSNDNSGYSIFNSFGAFGVYKWSSLLKRRLNILEFGAGTGHASIMLLKWLKKNKAINKLDNYFVTDISPAFLRMAKRLVKAEFPDFNFFSFQKLDFDQDLGPQVDGRKFDIVYGVNALHVANDISKTLNDFKKILTPGGMLIFCECVRSDEKDILVQEFILNLLDSYVQVKLDENFRVTPGFLPYKQWEKFLDSSNYKGIQYKLNSDGCENDGSDYLSNVMVIKGEAD